MKQTILILLGILHAVLSIPLPEQIGSYAFSYDTNTGGFHSQSGSPSGASGKYGFNTPEGNLNVQFSAGAGGGDGAPATSYSAFNGANGGGSGTYSLNLHPDGTYSYNYDLNDQGKSESRKTDGEVEGMFYFTGKDGQKKSIEYTAGRGGFQPKGDHIPKADDGANGMPSPYSAFGGNGDSGNLMLNLNPGGDYSYSYNLKDQSKSETGSGGKVKGQFSFVAPDGKNRAIKYTADEMGFVAEGDHLPKPVEPLPVNGNVGNPVSYMADFGAGAGPSSYSFDYAAQAHGRSEQGNSGDVKGDYSVMSTGGNQKSSYTAGKGGFMPTHDIKINLG